jgi:hypothetical protein
MAYELDMSDADLDKIIAALRAGKRFSIYGADGEWGFDALPDGKFRSWAHDPGQDVPDEIVDEESVRRSLRNFEYERIASRLT